MSGAEQAVVTDLDEAVGEDVLEEAADELLSGDGAVLELIGGGLFVSESDGAVFQLAQAVVAEGHAKDVRGEILEGLFAGAHGFGMHDPVFAPDARSDCSEQISLFQFIAKLGAEDHGEGFNGHQKVGARGTPAAICTQAAASDDVMNMRVIEQLPGPGMQYAHHAKAAADEPWVLGQLL